MLLASGVSATRFMINDIRIDSSGSTGTAEMRMDIAPVSGFSGYNMDFSIVDPSVAEIITVRYNAALTGMTETSSCPFSSGHIGWVDTNEILRAPGGEERILLATITFRGKLPGTTLLKTIMTIGTDDKGDNLIPSSVINSPTIIVAGEPAVSPLPLPDCAEESVPLDPDKDGAYEDLNGDNQVDIMDVSL